MNPPSSPGKRCSHFLAVFLAIAATPFTFAQVAQTTNAGILSDWTDRHIVFANPGTLQEAIAKGQLEDWLRITNDPRYRMQQAKRHEPVSYQAAGFDSQESIHVETVLTNNGSERRRRSPLHSDWAVTLAGNGGGLALGQDAAKYSFSPIGSPDCTSDFVIFPIDSAGSRTQADLVGANNLYLGTCTGAIPTVLFAYAVGVGDVQTSPALSLDGTKVAFVESINNASRFHVLTLDKSGNSGCPNTSPCNGTAFNSPAIPGTNNAAVDTRIIMSGGESVTRSSPFVDYSHDVAYVGDDAGNLHKFTNVFAGTPTEAGSPWPVTVASGVVLGAPVFDGGASQNIFVGGSDGNLYCVTSAGAACSTAKISVGTGPILDGPIVDSTEQTVFAAANTSTNAILSQTNTALGAQVTATMGMDGTDLYDGAFDNAYFTDVSSGHMYFCGNLTTAATPTLLRVTFDSNGTMSSSNDGNTFELVNAGNKGPLEDCTPLTEVFNTAQNIDYLFVGVEDNGFSSGTPNCANNPCLISFSLPTSSPFAFPTAARSTLTTNLGGDSLSGMIIDNVSGEAGASQLYFGNLLADTGVQVSQSALQ